MKELKGTKTWGWSNGQMSANDHSTSGISGTSTAASMSAMIMLRVRRLTSASPQRW